MVKLINSDCYKIEEIKSLELKKMTPEGGSFRKITGPTLYSLLLLLLHFVFFFLEGKYHFPHFPIYCERETPFLLEVSSRASMSKT